VPSLDNTNRDFTRFLSCFGLVVLIGVVLVMLFVAIVDPYGLYGFVDAARFNVVKPGLMRYQAQIKEARARRLRPEFVI
jgi:hypothetical protein